MRFQKEGKIVRKQRTNPKLKITSEIISFVKQNVRLHPIITLWELSKLVDKQFKIKLSDHSIYNILHQIKITRKRLKNKYYPEKKEGQEQDDLKNFYKQLSQYKYDKTICLDKTSIYLNMTSSYGRSKSGTRAIYKTNKYPFKRYNMLCAISANKVIGYVLYKDLKGGIKTNNIIDFYNAVIKDNYKDHLFIMDNAIIHKSKIIRQTIEESGNHLLYSVPYHPETNAIEEFFSQLKHYIKQQSPNTYDDIQSIIKDIIKNKIIKEHLTNYLKHSFRMYKNK